MSRVRRLKPIKAKGETKEKDHLRFEAKTEGQRRYLKSLHTKDFTICSGPPGCGKTYLAMAVATKLFREQVFANILVVRPLVETGRELGALPGDVNEKIDPYMQPVIENLRKAGVSHSDIQTMKNSKMLRVMPLELIRGMTFDQTFMVLDEAQNATREQIKMFLTRIGEGSRIAITGDPDQSDLPNFRQGGFIDCLDCLSEIPEVDIVHLSDQDVVRHGSITKILSRLKNFHQAAK